MLKAVFRQFLSGTSVNELLRHFEATAEDLMFQLEQALKTASSPPEGNLFEKTCDCFFEKYLMDEYCNKIMRLLSIEHLGNIDIAVHNACLCTETGKNSSFLYEKSQASGISVPKEIKADAKKVGYGLADHIWSKKFVICHSANQAVR